MARAWRLVGAEIYENADAADQLSVSVASRFPPRVVAVMLRCNMTLPPRSLAFALLIAGLAALPPLSIDMGLPAMNAMGVALAAPASLTGLTLSLYMAGFALAQLAFGPLSDRLGRRAPLIGACALYTAAGLFCALAGGIGTLLVWRFLQGAGAGGATVLAFAIVRDSFEGAEARAKMGVIGAVMTIAPMVAPSLGALVLRIGDWRAIFAALCLAGLALTGLVAFGLAESIPARDAAALSPRRLARSYARALTHRSALGHSLLGALSFGCLFAFVSGSPFVFIGVLGLSPTWFGLLFATTSLGIMAGSLLCARLSAKGVDAHRLLAAAVIAQALCALALLTLALLGLFVVADALPLLVLANVAMGVVMPLSIHGAMEPFPDMAGVASAVRGCAQMLVGALSSALVAALFTGTATALPLCMSLFSCASAAAWLAMVRPAEAAARVEGART
jgi:DHA1 family bicyclomycin/chloramphenicol resistance-like MFS transporter